MNNYSMRRKINRFLNLHIKKHKELITIFLSITSILYVGLRLFYNEYLILLNASLKKTGGKDSKICRYMFYLH